MKNPYLANPLVRRRAVVGYIVESIKSVPLGLLPQCMPPRLLNRNACL